MKTILLTGATGTLGRPVAALLRTHGHDVRGLSRNPGQDFRADLTSGNGLDTALRGVDAVVHCASDTRRMGRGDVTGTRNLLNAATRAGHPYVLFVSIVGVDTIPYPYYRVKLRAEQLVRDYGGGVLRATQFHDFVLGGARLATRLPIVPAPDVAVQPIATRDVAARIAAALAAPVSGRLPDLGGPQVLQAPDLFRDYLDATGSTRRLVAVRLPGAAFRAFRAGAHLVPGHLTAGETWADFLQVRIR
ncbi:SDR family oxidoreductase [Actinoplanes couchii]|uniref:Nucleotide-diphosphate-sugar epimerase n=1 Tax=Actinoplanes couchii TaxID=403638 RepID=A0ABQ3XPK9_9ACTN|nr:NAD(P)H-binding protein [Actinoplanes couchii]MDR6319107.1 uncharacterized protein YbjT (DUF2867 family) [Actinoplanes couchii]GID60448.1 nucleotide-diphosphate-sugar epimerase [Actinoplanes couchii]